LVAQEAGDAAVSAASFVGVILAAGGSIRMGRDKALLPWDGTTFLSATIERLKPFTQLVIVVAGANAKVLAPEVYSRGAFLVVNPEPERGQFSSLRVGLQEVLNRGRDAAVVTLVDRPPASAHTMERLMATFVRHFNHDDGKWAVVPECDGKHGHPIVIGREMMEAFLRADEATTARDVEHANQKHLEYLQVEDRNVITNINTPEDYQELIHVQ
jgi:molybdenum cofactor cytidylyltransferase